MSNIGGGGAGGGGSIFSSIAGGIQLIPGLGQLAGVLTKVAGAVKAGIDVGFNYNRVLEENTIAFEVMLGSADKAALHLKDLARFAETSPFEFPEIIGASKRMQAMGFSIKEIIPTLRAVSDASSALGSDMDGIILALGQMRQKGKVSAEEMNQLVERGIPAWEILSKAIGKTVQETQKLGQRGRLSGVGAAQALAIGINERYGGIGKRVAEETASGLEANLNDIASRLAGTATGPMFEQYKNFLRKALNIANNEVTAGLARGAAKVTGGAFDTIGEAVSTGTDIAGGLLQGISGTGVKAAVQFLGDFSKGIGRNSPATEFIPIGEDAAEGFIIGFTGRMQQSGGVMGLFGADTGGMSKRQAKSYNSLSDLTRREPEFLRKLVEGARKRGINPDDLLNVIALETAGTFSPKITNPLGYTGLIQFGKSAAKDLGTSTGALRGMTATQQLEYVFKYLDQHLRGIIGGGPVRADQLYSSIGAGHAKRDPNAVHFRRGSREYAWNANSWDVDRSGAIQQWEFGAAPMKHLGAGQFFTVNGQKVSGSNPMPVAVAAAPYSSYGRGENRFVREYREGLRGAAGMPPVDLPMNPMAVGSFIAPPPAFTETQNPETAMFKAAFAAEQFRQAIGLVGEEAAGMNGILQQTEPILTEVQESAKFLGLEVEGIKQGFEDAFVDSFMRMDEGFKGMLSSFALGFAQTLQQMAAQAAASQVSGWLSKVIGLGFSALAGGIGGAAKSSVGAGLSGGLSGGAALFGGGKAMGGPVSAGVLYETHGLGKREWFVPSTSGRIDTKPGGPTYNITNNLIMGGKSSGRFVRQRPTREMWETAAGVLKTRLA